MPNLGGDGGKGRRSVGDGQYAALYARAAVAEANEAIIKAREAIHKARGYYGNDDGLLYGRDVYELELDARELRSPWGSKPLRPRMYSCRRR